MNIYELEDPKILGEEHPQYGFTFWDSQIKAGMPVMFNSKQGNILPGTRISAESVEPKVSKAGKDYLRLKKVTFEDSPVEHAKPFEPKPEPTFTKSVDKPFFRDATTMPADFMKSLMPYYDVQSLVKDGKLTEQGRSLVETAQALAEEAMAMVDIIRNGGSVAAVPTPSAPIKDSRGDATAPIHQKLAEADWTQGLEEPNE